MVCGYCIVKHIGVVHFFYDYRAPDGCVKVRCDVHKDLLICSEANRSRTQHNLIPFWIKRNSLPGDNKVVLLLYCKT